MTEFLTVPEIAAELRVDETTVRRHIRTGALRASKPFGVVRINRDDLDTYLQATVVQADTPRPTPMPRPARSRTSPVGGSVRDRLRADRKKAA